MLGNGSAFGTESAPRPAVVAESFGDVAGEGAAGGDMGPQAVATTTRNDRKARIRIIFLRKWTECGNKVVQSPLGCRELADAIGAQGVHADRVKPAPECGIIRRPRDNARANRMRTAHQIFVDVVDVLPEIFGSRCDERSDWIHVPRDLEHTAADSREYLLDVQHDAMIK